MKVVIINGPMGVGKTTVGKAIADKCPGTAFIDGDWCMDLHPFVGNRETKDMAIDNILHMIGNYRDCYECSMIVLAWLMDDEWVISKLLNGIEALRMDAASFTLVCDEQQLKKQWKEDTSCPWRTDDWLESSIRSLEYFRGREDCIDITGKSADDVADLIIRGSGVENSKIKNRELRSKEYRIINR